MMLSQLVASTVMAGELSLMAAQVSGDLVSAHEKLGHILVCFPALSLTNRKGAVEHCLLSHTSA